MKPRTAKLKRNPPGKFNPLKYFNDLFITIGAGRSVEDRLLRKQEASGSNPDRSI